MPILKIENLSAEFANDSGKLSVIKNVNLEIKKGEFICIVGPSGCGKTTFLNIISGLMVNYKGNVLYKNKPIKSPSSERLMIFQDLGLFPWLTVYENVEFGLKLKKIPKKEREQITLQYLELINLVKFKDFYIHQLSGGMRQRVALARIWAMDPELLLMDEPFSSLDVQTRDDLHNELQKLWAKTKKTIIFITHNVREAVCLGDRVIVFSSHPAQVKACFPVDRPRPRHIEDQELLGVVELVMVELKSEIKKYIEEKYDVK